MKKLLTLLLMMPFIIQAQQIHLDLSTSFNLNNIGDQAYLPSPLYQLQDGITNVNLQSGYGKLVSPDEYIIPCNITLTDVKLFCLSGSTTSPWKLYADNGTAETLLASFSGGTGGWIDYPQANPIVATALHILSYGYCPTEWILTGIQSNPATQSILSPPTPTIYFNDQLGVNTFSWSWCNNDNSCTPLPGVANHFSPFTGERLYVTWNLIEQKPGSNTFNPTHSGGWGIDTILYTMKSAGQVAIFDLKEQLDSMAHTFPAVNYENMPLYYSNFTKSSMPTSYKEMARTGYQIAARYGSTKHPASDLTIDQSIRWTGDLPNQKRSGLGYLTYIEAGNEWDASWMGLNRFQNAYQYAANLSAVYDADQGRIPGNYGVKAADKNMQVVMGGACQVSPSDVNGIVYWSKLNRGGSIPFDVCNYHIYSGTKQPEGTLEPQLEPIVAVCRSINKPLWITEIGYDIQPGSPNAAPSESMRANWILRSALLMSRIGVARTFFYEDYDLYPNNATAYGTSGLLTTNGRKADADYMYQAKNLMKGYYFKYSSRTGDAIADVYSNGSKTITVAFLATSRGQTFQYYIPSNLYKYLGAIYQPVIGGDNMQGVPVTQNVVITECPTFFVQK